MRLRVDVRWRPSKGRGEYEHVPSAVLMEKRVIVDSLVVPGAKIVTDVTGRMRDGKPRLRRDNPYDRKTLNLPQLIAALALLPDSRRQDIGSLTLPLRAKQYLIKRIGFDVLTSDAESAVCLPVYLQVLHYAGEIDLTVRMPRVGQILRGEIVPIPAPFKPDAEKFLSLVQKGTPNSELRSVADRLIQWASESVAVLDYLDAPGEELVSEPLSDDPNKVQFEELTADETKRRLRTHYRLDRNRKLRDAKVANFISENGGVYCENCSFEFERKYGIRGRGFIEIHHTTPLAGLLPNTVTRLGDLLLLCANCHRMVHRKRPDLTVNQLREITHQDA